MTHPQPKTKGGVLCFLLLALSAGFLLIFVGLAFFALFVALVFVDAGMRAEAVVAFALTGYAAAMTADCLHEFRRALQ